MAAQFEAVFFGQFALQFFDAGIADFHNLTAAEADQVVVVAVGPGHFIAGDAVAEVDLHSQARVAEQLERTVNRSLPDAGIALQICW